MKSLIYLYILLVFSFLSTSCGEKKNNEAVQYLEHIKILYDKGNYIEALQKIDSIQLLFPKSFEEIKKGLALQQQVRRASDNKLISDSDSLLSILRPQIDSIKEFFIYRKEADDESGIFSPKSTVGYNLTYTMLRAGVHENGSFYLESVYIGGQMHNRLSVTTKDKQTAESSAINDDGLNFRFNNLGKQYEIIKITGFHDNGLSEFILANASSPLTVTLKGKNTTSYALSKIQLKAIIDANNLSKMLLLQDSLSVVKDKALTRIKYLDSKVEKKLPNDKE